MKFCEVISEDLSAAISSDEKELKAATAIREKAQQGFGHNFNSFDKFN